MDIANITLNPGGRFQLLELQYHIFLPRGQKSVEKRAFATELC